MYRMSMQSVKQHQELKYQKRELKNLKNDYLEQQKMLDVMKENNEKL